MKLQDKIDYFRYNIMIERKDDKNSNVSEHLTSHTLNHNTFKKLCNFQVLGTVSLSTYLRTDLWSDMQNKNIFFY